jgi:hypothetical protein
MLNLMVQEVTARLEKVKWSAVIQPQSIFCCGTQSYEQVEGAMTPERVMRVSARATVLSVPDFNPFT